MKRVVVTGGSGKAGRVVIQELLEHGYDVMNVDLLPPCERLSPYLKTDLTDLGQVFEVLLGANAEVQSAVFLAQCPVQLDTCEYHWQDGIGPRIERPSHINTHWGGVTESNAFGAHEFFDLCAMIGAVSTEP